MTATPAAASAAPAAAAVAPAAPTAAAPAAPAPSPAAVVAPAAAPAATEPPSLIDGAVPPPVAVAAPTAAEALAAARKLVEAADLAADPNGKNPDGTPASWLLHEGVMGQGAKPEWFRSDKYKTVAAQAEAYVGLEKRMGAFVGAPKDGKYEFKAPDGIEFDANHPVIGEFGKWAAAHQLSQDGYVELMTMFAQHEAAMEAAQTPDMGAIKARLGENADERVSQVAGWVKANMGAEGLATFRAATNGNNADAVFKLVEQMVGKTNQPRIPATTDATAATPGEGLAAINKKFFERLPDGRLRVDVEPGRRMEIQKELTAYFADMPAGTRYVPDGFKST